MASQTKLEPSDAAMSPAPLSGVGASSRGRKPELAPGEGVGEPASHVDAIVAGGPPGDDEDVSLDELMMSGEEDEPDEATDARGVVARAPAASGGDAPAGEDGEASPEAVETAPTEAAAGVGYAAQSLEDDEAAALAAAAAAQEAAAQAAEAEAGARRAHAEGRATDEQETPSAPALPGDALATPSGWGEATEAGEPAAATAATAEAAPPLEPAGDADDDQEPPMSVDFEPPSQANRELSLGDGPLPSFDIPEAAAAAQLAAEAPSRLTPRPMAALPQLSEMGEDDDEVTHIGLPVVPESALDYPGLGAPGFSVAEPEVAALQGFEPDLSLTDARRATTRVVPRIDPAALDRRRLASDPVASRRGHGPFGTWLSGVFKRQRPEAPAASAASLPEPSRRRAGWLLDTVLPPLSLVLFGSGIGAGIMLLQPDRGAKAVQQTQTVQALRDAKRPTTLAERAEAGEGDALFKITNMAPSERTSALTLALERGYQAQRQNEFKEFARTLEAPSGLSTPNLTTRFLSYVTSPETMLVAFSHLTGWPGPTGPDVLYNVWEKAPGGSRAASLAQQLLHSEDQRAKATPALLTALDLRSATSCDDYLRVLPAVKASGDQRCSATLRALKHKDGCGDDGKQDCFACLRDSALLDEALGAIEGRAAPLP